MLFDDLQGFAFAGELGEEVLSDIYKLCCAYFTVGAMNDSKEVSLYFLVFVNACGHFDAWRCCQAITAQPSEDEGRVVILDPRILTKAYGRIFLDALPHGVRVEMGGEEFQQEDPFHDPDAEWIP